MTEFEKLLSALRALPPSPKVETQAQADAFTATDPFGHKWQVGEEYFEMPIHRNSLLAKGVGLLSPSEKFKHFASKG